jgi:YidC/Oxa1 family membrane protein insertase
MREKRKDLYLGLLVVLALVLTSCRGGGINYEPIDGFKKFFWDVLVLPMALLMYGLGKTVAFQYYSLTIVFATIIVRTLAWPIYAKTNDMSLKFELMSPHLRKIEEKYAGKDDPINQQRKQMEMMQLYKKYGIGLGGCLLPFLQLPIFLAFFQTLQRIPLTRGAEFKYDFSFMNGKFFGIDLFSARGELWSYQWWGIVILALLVGVTQIISHILATRRQKKIKQEAQADVPAYRQKQADPMQKQTETMMKFMIYFMTIMMVIFVYQSAAALGLYWLVGNIYSTLQAYIGHLLSRKRKEKLMKRI